jgi:hypothetical protein
VTDVQTVVGASDDIDKKLRQIIRPAVGDKKESAARMRLTWKPFDALPSTSSGQVAYSGHSTRCFCPFGNPFAEGGISYLIRWPAMSERSEPNGGGGN